MMKMLHPIAGLDNRIFGRADQVANCYMEVIGQQRVTFGEAGEEAKSR